MASFAAKCEQAVGKLAPKSRARHRRQVRALVDGAQVTSVSELIRAFPSLNKSRRLTAVWLLGHIGGQRAVPVLLSAIASDTDAGVRGQAAFSITVVGGKRAVRGLLRLGRAPDVRPEVLLPVAYALSFLFDISALDFLLEHASTGRADVRAQSAEGVANLLHGYDRRTRVWRNAVATLEPGLRDESAEVRFWSAFALGMLRATPALPALKRAARSDHKRCAMGWSVAEEAKDAIYCIETGKWPERDAFDRTQQG